MIVNLPWFHALVPLVIALVICVVGIVILKKNKKKGISIIVASIFIVIVMVPSLLMDSIKFTDKGITHHTGIWFIQRVYGLEYKDTREIEIHFESGPKGRQEEIWYITNSSGDTKRVNPADLWVMNSDLIAKKCRENRIRIYNDKGY